MGRVEKFRGLRIQKQKYIMAVILFAMIITAGVFTVDLSVNSLMGSGSQSGIINISTEGSLLKIDFMNKELMFNLEYLNRDFVRLRHLLGFK